MKKNIFYLLVLLVLAVAAYFALKKEEPLFSKADANFKVENTSDVTKIFLSDPGVGNIKLTKNAEGVWIVNDKYRARQDWVVFLLEGMAQQNATQMVPKSAHNTTVKQLAGNSVKVEVFQGDKKTHAYFVAKDPSRDNLTVMLNIQEDGTNAPRPFLVSCGHGGTFLGVRYRTDIEDWRDKRIFLFAADELSKIEIDYPQKTSASFTIKLQPKPVITPAMDTGQVNELRLEKYISFYDKLFCMGFENDYILKDTFVRAFEPFAKVKVTSSDGESHSLNTYYRQVHKATHKVITVNGQQYDGDSFFGLYDGEDFMLISSLTAQKILRERQEFFTTKKTSPSVH
jgi:hypothetical protein